MKGWIELTDKHSKPVLIGIAWIEHITADPLVIQAYGVGVNTVVMLSNGAVGVTQTYDEVVAAIKENSE